MFKVAINNLKKARPNLLWATGILLLIFYLSFTVAKSFYGARTLLINKYVSRYTILQIFVILNTSISFTLLMTYILLVEKVDLRSRNLRIWKTKKLRNFMGGAILGFIAVIVMVSLLLLFGSIYLNKAMLTLRFNYRSIQIIALFFTWSINSLFSEFIIRGWLHDVLERRYNTRVAMFYTCIVAVFYSFIILGQGTVISIVNIILINTFLGLMAYIKGNIYVTAGMNATLHWTQLQVLGFNIPGMRTGYSLFSFSPSGSNYINGGYMGPMAGIVATILLALSILFTVIINERKMLDLMNKK